MASPPQSPPTEPEPSRRASKRKRDVTCSLLSPDGNDIVELVMKRAVRERRKTDGRRAEMDRERWLDFANAYSLQEIRDLLDQCLHGDVVEACRTMRSARDLDGLPVAHLHDLKNPDTIKALAHGDHSGWYLIILFDERDEVESMFYVGQAIVLFGRVDGHRKCALQGQDIDSMIYYMWSRPGKHAKAVYLGHIEPGLFGLLLHKQCLLTLGEEILSVYLQSLHPSILTRYLKKTEIQHRHRGLQRKFPLEGGYRGQVADIAYLQISGHEEYADFARQRLLDRPLFHIRQALECGFLSTARSGQKETVELMCENCGFVYVDVVPYYVTEGSYKGYYRQTVWNCLMKCGSGRRSMAMTPTDPQCQVLSRGHWRELSSLYLDPQGLSPETSRNKPYSRDPQGDEPREVVLHCGCCKSAETIWRDLEPTYSRLSRQTMYINSKMPCAALCCGVGPSSLHYHEPVDPKLPCVRNLVVAHFWAKHIKTITTNHSMEKFITASKTVEAEATVSQPRSTEAEVTFSRHSLWEFLDSALDDSDSIGAETGGPKQRQHETACSDGVYQHNSIWHFLGPEADAT